MYFFYIYLKIYQFDKWRYIMIKINSYFNKNIFKSFKNKYKAQVKVLLEIFKRMKESISNLCRKIYNFPLQAYEDIKDFIPKDMSRAMVISIVFCSLCARFYFFLDECRNKIKEFVRHRLMKLEKPNFDGSLSTVTPFYKRKTEGKRREYVLDYDLPKASNKDERDQMIWVQEFSTAALDMWLLDDMQCRSNFQVNGPMFLRRQASNVTTPTKPDGHSMASLLLEFNTRYGKENGRVLTAIVLMYEYLMCGLPMDDCINKRKLIRNNPDYMNKVMDMMFIWLNCTTIKKALKRASLDKNHKGFLASYVKKHEKHPFISKPVNAENISFFAQALCFDKEYINYLINCLP